MKELRRSLIFPEEGLVLEEEVEKGRGTEMRLRCEGSGHCPPGSCLQRQGCTFDLCSGVRPQRLRGRRKQDGESFEAARL